MQKKLIVVLAFLALSLFIPFRKTSATMHIFTKSTNNPLPVTFLPGYGGIFQVAIFKQSNNLKGIFVITTNLDSSALALAESPDGVRWKVTKEVLKLDRPIAMPRILFLDSSRVKLFFVAKDSDYHYRIYSVDCDISFNCQKSPTLTMERDPAWESTGLVSPYPYFRDGTYYLFYAGWISTDFRLRLATSTDGVNWKRCPPDNPIPSRNEQGDGPFLFEKDGKYFLFYHDPLHFGIKVVESSDPLGCSMRWSTPQLILKSDRFYDGAHIIAPSVIEKEDGTLSLYYSGLGAGGWKLNLANTGDDITPLPQPPPEKTPIVIIPGIMGSWNKNAILHNQPVGVFDWKIPSFVKEYAGIQQTLKNIGYEENKDFFFFPYDWRKSIESTAADLDVFLKEKVWKDRPTQKIQIVGHSLGGLVGRIYTQKYKNGLIQNLVTAGTPHKGAVQAYKPLAAGEIESDNTFVWLAQKIVLLLNKDGIESNKETLQSKFPVLFDLLPTFNFLKDAGGNEIDTQSMSIKNPTLPRYNSAFSEIFSIFNAVFGEKDNQTPAGFTVSSQSILDIILDNYTDGHPQVTLLDMGDRAVLSKSSKEDADQDYEKLPFDHGEVVTEKDSIKKILQLLDVSYTEDKIVAGSKTTISPALIFFIKSPATMTVEYQEQTYQEEDGLIFIPGAQTGDYTLKVQGIDEGKYTVIIGQFSEKEDLWTNIEGKITQTPAATQTDTYTVQFNSQDPAEFPIRKPNIFESFNASISEFTLLNENLKNQKISTVILYLKYAKAYYRRRDFLGVVRSLLASHTKIFEARKMVSRRQRKLLVAPLGNFENLYHVALTGKFPKPSAVQLKTQLNMYRLAVPSYQAKIQKLKKQGVNVGAKIDA
ncbi:hypothetical protein HYT33_04785, partial [Candidatus Roizmanbacteria bacterium]|nr:hypothetical protein [Candidatus Roizmanbacteria bacterium]